MTPADFKLKLLIQGTQRAAGEFRTYLSAVQHALDERYGVSYGDVDCDVIIDRLDYSQGLVDDDPLPAFDAAMAALGHPPKVA